VPVLGAVSQLGVVLYMFLVGLAFNPDRLHGRLPAAVGIAQASIILPFALGVALAGFLHPRFATTHVAFTSFALFVGVAMSITAFPVLARILADRGLTHTDIGALALAAAAIGDVTAWCLLAFVVGVVQSDAGGAVRVALLTLGFVAVVFAVVRPVVSRLARRRDGPTSATVAAVLLGLLVAALFTEAIGVHALFGAFLFGVVIPHDSALARALQGRFERPVTLLLLPAFFALTGMRTEIGLLSGWHDWTTCGLVVLVATAGKLGGTTTAARLAGIGWREAASLGVLMNTRGLMEIIVLSVGLDLGVISPTLFTMFVLMALITTLATTPVLRGLMRRGGPTTAPARPNGPA
jgi:Kef-type K+ transport system membrane component KefB